MNKLEKIKSAFEGQDQYLARFAYNSWLTIQFGNSYKVTTEQIKELYNEIIADTKFNLENSINPKKYETLFSSIIEMGAHVFSFEKWVEKYPESEQWGEWIEKAIEIEKKYNEDPERWINDYIENFN
jgi:hypothetical protein